MYFYLYEDVKIMAKYFLSFIHLSSHKLRYVCMKLAKYADAFLCSFCSHKYLTMFIYTFLM